MALKHIQTIEANGDSSIDFTNVFDDSADRYVIYCDNLVTSGSSEEVQVQFSSDGGSTWDSGTSDYAWSIHKTFEDSSTSSSGSSGSSYIDQTLGFIDDSVLSNATSTGVITISDPSDSNRATILKSKYSNYNPASTTSFRSGFSGGQRLSQSSIDSIQFFLDTSDSFASGIFSVYAVTQGEGNAKEHIETIEASGQSSINFTNVFASDDGFDRYEIHCDNVIPDTDGVNMESRLSSDGGVNWDSGTSDYSWSRFNVTNSSTGATGLGGDSKISNLNHVIGNDPSNSDNSMAEITISDPTNSNRSTILRCDSYSHQNSAINPVRRNYSGGIRLTQSAIDSIQFFMDSGNVAEGTFSVYGIGK